MSDLQGALLAVGVAIIAGVIGYNKWQERKYRRLGDSEFGVGTAGDKRSGEDVRTEQVDSMGGVDARIEPELARQPDGRHEQQAPNLDTSVRSSDPQPDVPSSPIDWCVLLRFPRAISGARIIELAAGSMKGIAKTVRLEGLESEAAEWISLTYTANVASVTASIQLCDRRGVISRAELDRFLSATTEMADSLGGKVLHEPLDLALRRALELDAFCADTDVQIGVNIVASAEKFRGELIAASAKATGGILAQDGSFHFAEPAGMGEIRMSNLEGEQFLPETLGSLSTSAVTLEIDVPRAKGGAALLDHLFSLASEVAGVINGRVVDDNHRELSDASRASIRSLLGGIHRRMVDRGIVPGDELALRLYS